MYYAHELQNKEKQSRQQYAKSYQKRVYGSSESLVWEEKQDEKAENTDTTEQIRCDVEGLCVRVENAVSSFFHWMQSA